MSRFIEAFFGAVTYAARKWWVWVVGIPSILALNFSDNLLWEQIATGGLVLLGIACLAYILWLTSLTAID